MNRTFRSIVMTGALLALPALAFAGSGEDQEHEHGGHDKASYWFGSPGDPSKVTRTIKVTAMDIRYQQADLTVKAGETVRFEVTNNGKLPHEFILGDPASQQDHEKEMQEMARKMPGMSMQHSDPSTLSLKPGETKSLVWKFTKPGKLQYACHVPGHYSAGMIGQLTVE